MPDIQSSSYLKHNFHAVVYLICCNIERNNFEPAAGITRVFICKAWVRERLTWWNIKLLLLTLFCNLWYCILQCHCTAPDEDIIHEQLKGQNPHNARAEKPRWFKHPYGLNHQYLYYTILGSTTVVSSILPLGAAFFAGVSNLDWVHNSYLLHLGISKIGNPYHIPACFCKAHMNLQ